MSSLLRLYYEMLKDYYWLQKSLYSVLETLVTLKPVDSTNYDFMPTYSSISEQIRHWPEGEFLLPPTAWVQPRKGKIKLDDKEWDFVFHGVSLSFRQPETGQEVIIEYSRLGDLCITNEAVLIYLETLSPVKPHIENLIKQHAEFFTELVKSGHLVRVPPLLPTGDQTFLLKPISGMIKNNE